MNAPKPNLFTHATRELSQDAILAWLLRWADPVHEAADKALHETGQFFIRKLYETAGRTAPPIDRIAVRTQENKIDILVRLSCTDGKKRVILIEDKVFAHENGDQLIRYPEYVRHAVDGPEDVLLIFLKTGFQHEWDSVSEKNYTAFTTEDLRAVWDHGYAKGVDNAIFADYGEHLTGLVAGFKAAEQAFSDFKNLPAGKWTSIWHWKGFMHDAQQQLHEAGSKAIFGEQQNNREHLLYLGFGLTPVALHRFGLVHTCEPGLNLTYANGQTKLEIRLWIKHLLPDAHPPIREALVAHIRAIPAFADAWEGTRRPANQSIRLLNLSLPAEWRNFTATQLLDYLTTLKTELAKIPRTITI